MSGRHRDHIKKLKRGAMANLLKLLSDRGYDDYQIADLLDINLPLLLTWRNGGVPHVALDTIQANINAAKRGAPLLTMSRKPPRGWASSGAPRVTSTPQPNRLPDLQPGPQPGPQPKTIDTKNLRAALDHLLEELLLALIELSKQKRKEKNQ